VSPCTLHRNKINDGEWIMENTENNQPAGEEQEIQIVKDMDLDEEEIEKPSKGSKKWLILGAVLLVFLAAAVFLGARLLKPQANQKFGGGSEMMISKGGPSGGKSVQVDMKPAKEIPQEQPTQSGIFVRREDQSIFIGTGNITMMAKKQAGSGGAPEVSSSYDGPVVEVVIDHKTMIYHDTTEMPEPDKAVNGVVTAQQTVESGLLDDLGSNTQVTVWGEKQGDRFIARVIVYR
jgi:hypothetical protein